MKDIFENQYLLRSVQAVAAHCGVDQRTVRRWLERGCPRRGDGWFDSREVDRWRTEKPKRARKPELTPQADNDGESPNPGKDFWSNEARKYLAETRKLEYRRRKGELVDIAQVNEIMEKINNDCQKCRANVKGGFLAMPSKLALMLDTVTAKAAYALMLEEIKRVLQKLADGFEFPTPKGDSDGDK